MNYFELYELPVTFTINKAALKRKFYELSRKYHPDFYTQSSTEEQERVLALSSMNNEAYKVLADFHARMYYILQLKGLLKEEGKNNIPQDFLMEMMDFNEVLMELEFDFDADALQNAKNLIETKAKALQSDIQPILDHYNDENANPNELLLVRDYYFKQKYIQRLRENLGKFE